MTRKTRSVLYLLFAEMLEYPTPALILQVAECANLLFEVSPQAGVELSEFHALVEQEPLSRLEEIYTNTFDLQGVCQPYVGYHMFGESYKRSWFMARLNEGYREKDFTSGSELPDHIAVILRFLAKGNDDEFSQVLQDEGLVPSVGMMVQAFSENGEQPYRRVLRALLLLTQDTNVPEMENIAGSEMGGLNNG